MRLLSLALAGLWWRRATSAMLLLVAVFTTAAAAAGPSYADSARDAVLQAALRRAPIGAGGTGLEVTAVQTGRPSTAGLRSAVEGAFTGAARRAYPAAVMGLSVVQEPATRSASGVQLVMLKSRDGLCRAVGVVAGSCLDDAVPTGVVVEDAAARAAHLRVGDVIRVVPLRGVGTLTRLTVRGIVTRRRPQAPYWFGGAPDTGSDTLTAWVPQSYFSTLRAQPGDGVVASADLTLQPSAVHASSVDRVSTAIDDAVRRIEADGTSRPDVSTGLRQVVRGGLAGGSSLSLPIVVMIAQLLALGWYLLHTLISGAAEARGAEVALSKVRGMTGTTTLLLVVLEPALLLAAAVPLGVVVASAVVPWMAQHALAPGAEVHLGWVSWAAAVAAAVGGLVAASTASVAVLRRPVLEQWRHTGRTVSRWGVVAEVVVVALAVAAVVQLQLTGSLTSGAGGGIALLAPMLLFVAGAVVASRLVVLLARLGFGPTRATGAVSAFVGLRQLARRPGGRRTFGVLVVAVAMAAYGVSSVAVLALNRNDRALTEVGAPTVVHITPDPRTEQRLRSVDAGGHELAAVAEVPVQVDSSSGVFGSATTSRSPTALVVDSATFASVAYWRSDFGSAGLAALLRPLSAPAPESPLVTGTRIELTVSAQSVPEPLDLVADLVDPAGASVTAPLGTLTPGTRTYTAPIAACGNGCRLRRVYVTRPVDQVGALVVRFTLRDARTPGGAGVRPALSAVHWAPLNPTPGAQASPAETIAVEPDGLRVTISVSGQPSEDAPGFGAVAGLPGGMPALATAGLLGDGDRLTAETPDGAALGLQPTGHVTVLPRAGDAGVVVARDWAAAASPSGSAHLLADEIWVGRGAPPNVVDRLSAAGVRVLSIEDAAGRSSDLAAEGPAFGTAFTVAGGVTAVLLAAAAVVLGLALLARRRVFELSAMSALGIRSRSLLGSVLVEQGVLIAGATVSGTVLAVAAVHIALPALPAYVDDPAYPAFVVDQPIGTIALVSAAIAVLLLAAVAVTAVVLGRSTSVVRLREAEQ